MHGRLSLAGVVILGTLLGLGTWAAPRALRSAEERYDRATGRDDLKALEREGLLSFRAPGTTLRETVKRRRDEGNLLGRRYEPASIEQRFTLEGDPVAAIEAYRDRAQADGWQLARSHCSRYERGAIVVLSRSTPIPAVLRVQAVLAGSPSALGAPPGAATSSVLSLTLTAHELLDGPGGGWPVGYIGCLHAIDPGDPAFTVRPVPVRTSAEICALLPIDRVRQIVPDVTVANPQPPDHRGRGECTYEQRPYVPRTSGLPAPAGISSRQWFSVVDAAADPRIRYEERKHPSAVATPHHVLLLADLDPARPPSSAWVDTPTGPVEVSKRLGDLDEAQLVAVAELLAGRP